MTFKKSLAKLVVQSNAEILKRIGLTNYNIYIEKN